MITFQCYAYQIDSSLIGTCIHERFGQRRIAFIFGLEELSCIDTETRTKISGTFELSLVRKVFHL